MGTASNPWDAGSPSQAELEREAANTGKSIEQVAKELGASTVTVVEHKDGVTTSTTKTFGAAPADRRTRGKHQ